MESTQVNPSGGWEWRILARKLLDWDRMAVCHKDRIYCESRRFSGIKELQDTWLACKTLKVELLLKMCLECVQREDYFKGMETGVNGAEGQRTMKDKF